MAAFISENLATLLTGAVVLAIVAFASIRSVRNIRRKKSCSCGCENCGRSDRCGK